MTIDQDIFHAMNSLAGKWPWLDLLGKFFASDYFLYSFAAVIALLWFYEPLRRRVYLALGSAFVVRGLIVEIIKRLIDRPRPFEILKVHQLIIDNEKGASFPSGHAAIYLAFALTFYGTKYFWPFLILAVIASLSRVFVGIHYPSDILAGALIGAVFVLALRKFIKTKNDA